MKIKKYNVVVFDQILVSGVNFFTGILLARKLGLEEYGRYVLIWMVVLFCMSIQLSGIVAPLMSLGAKNSALSEKRYYDSISIFAMIWAFLCGLVLFLTNYVLKGYLVSLNIQNLILPVALVVPFWLIQDYYRRYYFVIGKEKLAFCNDLISYVGQVMLLIIYDFHNNLNGGSALIIIGTSSLLAVIFCVLNTGLPSFAFSDLIVLYRESVSFSKWLVVSSLLQWTTGNYFQICLGVIVGPIALGAVRAAQNIMGVTHVLFQAMENIVPVSMASHYKDSGIYGMKIYFKKAILICSGPTILFCILTASIPELILHIFYGNQYRGSGYLLYWFFPIYILISFGLPLRSSLRALSSTRPIFLSYFLITIFSLGTASIFVKQFGINGAMMGTLLAQVLFQGILFLSFKYRIKTLIN